MPTGLHTRVRFGSFEVDGCARVLRRHGVKIHLQEQPFEVLLALVQSPGQVVTREQLRQRLWPQGTFVEFDHALNTAVKKIRAALCDDAALPRYIETIPRRGYRFLAPVDTADSTGAQLLEESSVERPASLLPRSRFRTVIFACALGISLLMLSAWAIFRAPAQKTITLAVLPFSNIDPAPASEPANDVFPEMLLQQLGQAHLAGLVIRNRIKAQKKLLSPIYADHSPIDYVVQGSLLGDQQHLHVTVQLVRLSDQHCVWARDIDWDSAGAETEVDIAREIVGQMQPTLALLSGEAR
jgi:DNA-binding winged helix-turn-helix (wHTH) protein/TolB-like protein